MVLTKLGTLYRKWENWILPALFVLILLLLLGLRFDYYYDLNDDVLMKDILSGVYTGAFESRNVQMLFPLSLILSFVCRIFGTSYVYGLFLCVCQFGSLYVILYRSMRFVTKTMGKATLGLLESLLFAALLLPQLQALNRRLHRQGLNQCLPLKHWQLPSRGPAPFVQLLSEQPNRRKGLSP